MDSKKQARTLQKAAKEFGYEIKLTHAQELIAQIKGFQNRHALFKEENIIDLKKSTELNYKDIVPEFYYYEIHVFENRRNSYSRYFKSKEVLNSDEMIINEAVKQNIIDRDDAYYVDYTEQLCEIEYTEATNY